MSATLSHILLYDICHDSKKHIYTGEYQCLTSKGYSEDISKVINNVAQFEDGIVRCEDASDLRQIIHENIDEKSHLNYYQFGA